MKDNIVREILFSYQKKREDAEYKFEERKKMIYNRFPEIQRIDDEITEIGLKMMRLVLSSSSEKETLLDNCRQDMIALKQKKDYLLEAHNIPKEALEIQYKCKICEDTGFLKTGEKCNCFKQALINEYYKMSNIAKNFETQNFNTLDLSLFSDEIIPGQNISSKQRILEISAICEMFVQNFKKENEENLLFFGDTGLGKTFMSNCIAKALLDKGFTVIYQTAFKMFDILEDYRFNNSKKENDNTAKENYDNLFECDLLIIDDLGTELTNTFTVSELFIIINTRLLNKKKTIISTNLTPGKLAETYTERTSSRIFDKFTLVKFIGKDLRWESQFN